MNPILAKISGYKTYEEVPDDTLDELISYMDIIFEEESGVSTYSLSELMSLTKKKVSTINLERFLHEFQEANPQLVYWFGWMPYRYYFPHEVWVDHVAKHNAKVDREYPEEERKNGLYIVDDVRA